MQIHEPLPSGFGFLYRVVDCITTLPKSHGEMIGTKDDSVLDIEPFTKNSLILKVMEKKNA